jgi:hypothetical protein
MPDHDAFRDPDAEVPAARTIWEDSFLIFTERWPLHGQSARSGKIRSDLGDLTCSLRAWTRAPAVPIDDLLVMHHHAIDSNRTAHASQVMPAVAGTALAHDLPRPRMPLIGRGQELAELREKELANENDKLARDNQKLIANGSTLNTALKRDAMNPPLENVEGVIREVDPSGLVRISIGSDAGLVKGNTLEVYRLNTQAPSESRYLGRIKLLDVRNTEAVGQLLSKPPVPPQVGDTVSSKIAGG